MCLRPLRPLVRPMLLAGHPATVSGSSVPSSIIVTSRPLRGAARRFSHRQTHRHRGATRERNRAGAADPCPRIGGRARRRRFHLGPSREWPYCSTGRARAVATQSRWFTAGSGRRHRRRPLPSGGGRPTARRRCDRDRAGRTWDRRFGGAADRSSGTGSFGLPGGGTFRRGPWTAANSICVRKLLRSLARCRPGAARGLSS
jgi:hypothetical protein